MSYETLNMTMEDMADTTPGRLEHIHAADGNSMFVATISKLKKTGCTLIDLTVDSLMNIKQETEDEGEEVDERDDHDRGLFSESEEDTETEGEGYYMGGDGQQNWDSNEEDREGTEGTTAGSAILVSEYPRINKVQFCQRYKDMEEDETWKDYAKDEDYQME